MQIKKETTISAMATDNQVIKEGDTVVFEAIGKCFTGTFLGFGRNGALRFKSVLFDSEVTFNIMPNSIERIYVANVEIPEQPFMNIPEDGVNDE